MPKFTSRGFVEGTVDGVENSSEIYSGESWRIVEMSIRMIPGIEIVLMSISC